MSQTTSICVNVCPGSFHLRVITTWILLFMPICLLLLFHCRVFLIPPFWRDVWQDWLVPRRPHRTLLLWHLPKRYFRRKYSSWSFQCPCEQERKQSEIRSGFWTTSSLVVARNHAPTIVEQQRRRKLSVFRDPVYPKEVRMEWKCRACFNKNPNNMRFLCAVSSTNEVHRNVPTINRG